MVKPEFVGDLVRAEAKTRVTAVKKRASLSVASLWTADANAVLAVRMPGTVGEPLLNKALRHSVTLTLDAWLNVEYPRTNIPTAKTVPTIRLIIASSLSLLMCLQNTF